MAIPLLASHTTSWHDGGVAVLSSTGELLALASERVGDRYKHSWNSGLAYEYLRQRLGLAVFAEIEDHFVDTSGGLETDGHHFYHACSCYYGSGFDEAAVLVVDGQGPSGDHLQTTTIWHGDQNGLELVRDINTGRPPFADRSIGHFYTAVSALAGFDQLFSEGKTMALAAYGRPSSFLDLFRQYVKTNGVDRVDVDPLLTTTILAHTLGPALYGWGPPSDEQSRLWRQLKELRRCSPNSDWPTQDDMNVAFAGQSVLEEAMLSLANAAKQLTGSRRLCLAGGVALNCVANGRVQRSGLFEDIYVTPAPADDGQALGRLYALAIGRGLACPPVRSAYLGPPYSVEDVRRAVEQNRDGLGMVWRSNEDVKLADAARWLSEGAVVGWFRDRSELGPRGLGHRSILADPRNLAMRDRINEVKGRERFRPVAPIVVEEQASEYFELDTKSPFMSFAVPMTDTGKRLLPAAAHVDGSARVQTLGLNDEPTLYALLRSFESNSGVPVLLNTSFNGPNEPIVETPEDALRAFVALGLDYLILGDFTVQRRQST